MFQIRILGERILQKWYRLTPSLYSTSTEWCLVLFIATEV
jgi:hypothetical protein